MYNDKYSITKIDALFKKSFLKIYKKSIKKMSHGHGHGNNPILKPILKNIEKNLKTEFIEIQGSKMYLDPGDSLDLSINGVYGELDTQIIKGQIKEGDIVIDIGANIGYYTLIFGFCKRLETHYSLILLKEAF